MSTVGEPQSGTAVGLRVSAHAENAPMLTDKNPSVKPITIHLLVLRDLISAFSFRSALAPTMAGWKRDRPSARALLSRRRSNAPIPRLCHVERVRAIGHLREMTHASAMAELLMAKLCGKLPNLCGNRLRVCEVRRPNATWRTRRPLPSRVTVR